MKLMLGFSTMCATAVAMALGSSGPVLAAPPADWSAMPVTTVNLFYPGASTYNWLVSPVHKKGNRKVPQGAACKKCHEDDEGDMGEAILDGGHPLEPNPPEGRPALIELSVQAAHDSENIYLRLQWETQSDGPARVAMMIDDGKVANFANQGCWVTCHNGMTSTPTEASEAKVKAQPLFGDAGMKKTEIHKYLASTRTDKEASWDKTKSPAEIAKIKAAGGFLDLGYWRMKDGKAQTKDAYVLEYRDDDAKNSIGDFSGSTGELKDGVYTVILQRKLDTGHPQDDKIFKVGSVYNIGFAIHDGKVKDRFHNVGFPVTLGIDADADINAVSVK